MRFFTDIEPPVISGLIGEKIAFTGPGEKTATLTLPTPTATDNSGYATLTSSHESPSTFPIGGSVVMYTAVDPYGNKATESYFVTLIGM